MKFYTIAVHEGG